jgi:capsule polysaccharide export protein KpsE/RkpR
VKRSTQTAPIEIPGEVEPGKDSFDLPQERSQVEAIEWIWLIWGQRRFVLRVTVYSLVFSFLSSFLISKEYDSTTRLMPPDSDSGSGMAMMAALAGKASIGLSSVAGDLLGLKSSGALFTDILRSRTVADRLIDRFDLRKVYRDRYWEQAQMDLGSHTSISEDRKSGVISITVRDHDPNRAAQMAQAYVEELDRLVAQVSTSSARRERIFIEQRLQTVKQELDAASQQFSQYASKNSTIDITAQAKATVDAAAKLEGELIATQSELDGLEQIYTKNNVRVRSLQARVDELRRQLHVIGGDPSDPAFNGTGNTGEFPSIRQLPLLGVKWADLYRETKIQETVYELLTQQFELAKIQEAKEVPVVKILDPANVPERKSFPPRGTVAFLGALLAMTGAIAWIILLQVWHNTEPSNPKKLLLQGMWRDVINMRWGRR